MRQLFLLGTAVCRHVQSTFCGVFVLPATIFRGRHVICTNIYFWYSKKNVFLADSCGFGMKDKAVLIGRRDL